LRGRPVLDLSPRAGTAWPAGCGPRTTSANTGGRHLHGRAPCGRARGHLRRGDMAGMTDGEAARYAYLAEGNAKQARKRVAADVLHRYSAGRLLLVNPTYKDYWDLPGGMAESNEPPRMAAERELREELGLTIIVGRVLVVDWDGPHDPWDDQLV